MMTGEVEFDDSFSESIVTLEGSAQIIFIGFFLTANIVIINVLIGIAITTLKHTEAIKENLRAMAKVLAVLELEQGIAWLRVRNLFSLEKSKQIFGSKQLSSRNGLKWR